MFSVQDLLNRLPAVGRPSKCRVCVVTHQPGRLGGTPGVDIKGVNLGFDWDANRVLLVPEQDIIPIDSRDAQAITAEAKKVNSPAGYAAYKRIMQLEAQLKEHGIVPAD
jgi:hypothetical protein